MIADDVDRLMRSSVKRRAVAIHAVWSRTTNERLAQFGLDFLASIPRVELIVERDAATTASLREILGGDDPAEIADLLADAAEPAEGMVRPLFSGLRERGRPTDPV